MGKSLFVLSAAIIIVALFSSPMLLAQNTSPYWSLAGNSNPTTSSKLGTTNLIPLRLFTNNTERLRIDETGRVGIGITTPVNILTVKSGGGTPAASWLNGLNSPVFVGFGENVSSEFLLVGASNTAGNRAVFQGRRSRGTLAAPAAVVNNDYITSLLASAFDGSTFQNPALVSFFVDGVPSAGNVPTRISFVTGSNAANRVERLKVGSTGNFNFNNNQLVLQQSSGNVGIGTTSPGAKLDVVGTGIFGSQSTSIGGLTGFANERVMLFYDGNVARARLNCASNVSLGFGTSGINDQVVIDNSGNVGIGTNAPVYKLSVIGAPALGLIPVAYIENQTNGGAGLHIKAGFNGAGFEFEFIKFMRPDGTAMGAIQQEGSNSIEYNTSSDKRLKNIIGASQKGLPDLMKINIYDYTFKSDPGKKVQTGFMAQELYEVFPQAASKPRENNEPADKNPWMVDYGRVTPLIIKSVQEQQQMIDELKKSNDNLKKQNENLEERILKLETVLANITANNNGTTSTVITNASLEQNKPNPFNKNTTIRYSIPPGSKGQINIYDQTGKLVKSLNANESGESELSGYNLASGTYTYTLMVNGKRINSRKMVITR